MLRSLIILMTLCVFVTVAKSIRRKRVADGDLVQVNQAPFMAAILINGQFKCTGAIISPMKILTTAECLRSECASGNTDEECSKIVTVKIGSNLLSRGGLNQRVERFNVHPNYDRSRSPDNIAIITLATDLSFTDAIRTVDLPKRSLIEGSNATAHGWGSTSIFNTDHSDQLYSMQLRIQNAKICKDKVDDMGVNDFCAFPVSKGSGLCENDMAAPMVQDNKLIGILSYRLGAYCSSNSHTYFVDVYKYLDFIVKDLREIGTPDRYQERCKQFWLYTSSKRLNLANMCGEEVAATLRR